MNAQIDNHTKRQTSVQPGCAALISQREQGVTHNQQCLDGSDVALVQSTTQQPSHTLAKLPASSPHIISIPSELAARAELRCTEEDSVQQEFREVWAFTRHVSHERGPIRDQERVVLSIPVQ